MCPYTLCMGKKKGVKGKEKKKLFGCNVEANKVPKEALENVAHALLKIPGKRDSWWRVKCGFGQAPCCG